MSPASQISRRSVLAGGLLLAAGCRHKTTPPKAPALSPDARALVVARASERALLAAYDSAIASASGSTLGQLTTDRAVHAQHLAALAGTNPTAAVLATGDTVGSLLGNSATVLRELAIAAVQGTNAALFASIAASHDVMLHE